MFQAAQRCSHDRIRSENLSTTKPNKTTNKKQKTREFSDANNADLYAEEAARAADARRAQMAAIPGMLPPSEAVGDDMADA